MFCVPIRLRLWVRVLTLSISCGQGLPTYTLHILNLARDVR